MELISNKAYRFLFAGGIVNGIGDRFSQVAVLTLLLNLTSSGIVVGAALAIRIVPYLLFSSVGGWLSDRFSRKKIMIITDLIRVNIALLFLFVNDANDIWIVYSALFLLAVGEAIYQPTRKSLIPRLVKKENLIKVNILEQAMLGIVLVMGSLTGGVVAFWLGSNVSFILNAASFLLAAYFISVIDIKKKVFSITSNRSFFVDIGIVWKVIRQSTILKWVLILEFLIPIGDGIFNVLISIYPVQIYHLGDLGIGLFYGALGIGLVLNFFVSRKIVGPLLLIGFVSLIGEGIAQLLVSQLSNLVVVILLVILVSFIGGIGNICFDTIVMRNADEQHHGSVFGILNTVSNVMLGLSMLGAGLLLEVLTPRKLGLIGGGVSCLIGGMLMLYLLGKKGKLFQ